MCLGEGGAGGTLESAWLLPSSPWMWLSVKQMFNLITVIKAFLYLVDELFSTGSCLMHIDPQRLEVSSFDA